MLKMLNVITIRTGIQNGKSLHRHCTNVKKLPVLPVNLCVEKLDFWSNAVIHNFPLITFTAFCLRFICNTATMSIKGKCSKHHWSNLPHYILLWQIRLIKALNCNSVSCVRASKSESAWFSWIGSLPRVHVGTRLLPQLLERTVGSAMNWVSFGPHSFSDLDFADDVTLLAKLLELSHYKELK